MQQNALRSLVLLLLMLLFAGSTAAENGFQGRGSGGWGAGLPYNRVYDPMSVRTLNGEVVWVKKLVPADGMADGLHLLLKTREMSLPVHLGPLWYLERQDFSLGAGDAIEVTGSQVIFEGMPALIAAEVKKTDNVLLLRETSGFPLWSAWRRR
jgi:hypothetical protein